MKQYDTDKLKAIGLGDMIPRETGTPLKRAGTKLVCLCMFHADSDPSFKVDVNKNTWHCYGSCNTGGDGIEFIMKYRGLDFQAACEYLTEHYDTSAVEEVQGKKGTNKGRKARPIMPVPDDVDVETLKKYLKNKFWLEKFGEVTKLWAYTDFNEKRLYYDVRFELQATDKKGNPIDGKINKQVLPFYHSSKGWQSGIPHDQLKVDRVLFNLHLLWKDPKKPVLVVEGCKCASDTQFAGLHEKYILTSWPGGANGIDYLNIQPLQERKVIIWPDNDSFTSNFQKAGYRAAYNLRERLKGNTDVYVLKAATHPSGAESGKGYDIFDYVQDGGDPLEYIENQDNVLSDDRVRVLAGLLEDAPVLSDFRSSGKFSVLKIPSVEDVRKVRRGLLINDDMSIKKTDANFLHILNHDPNFQTLVAYDIATNDIKFSKKYTELQQLINKIWEYCLNHYSLGPSTAQRSDIIQTIAYRNIFNSLELFLDELRKDISSDKSLNIERNPLHQVLEHITFCVEMDYTDKHELYKLYFELFDKFFIRMFLKLECIITGNMENIPPADIVPILEGEQGIGKSRLCKFFSLEEQKYYVDTSDLELKSNRDTVSKIKGKLIAELGELSALKKTEIEDVKSFVSATFDEIRRLYSENTVKTPRTISIIGTTNEGEYLRDWTGNRRWWPVRIQSVLEGLFKKKDLIKHLYVYYHERARKAINEDKVREELLVSSRLFKFAQYMREEKRVKPVYLDRIVEWLDAYELGAGSEENVIINISAAIIKIVGEYEASRIPMKFKQEMIMQLKARGYVNGRGMFEGRLLNIWTLNGRYCPGCKKNVESLTTVYSVGKERGVCDDCLRAEKTEPEPF